MNSITKKFGQLKQFVSESVSKAPKTETSNEFQRCEQETAASFEGLESLLSSVEAFHRQLSKKRDGPDKTVKMPLQNLASSMLHSSLLSPEGCPYGAALKDSAAAHERIASAQWDFASSIRDGLLHRLNSIAEEYKEYHALKKKLHNRRLDLDAKLNKVQQSKKENLPLEEEVRVAQNKYEETLALITEKMIALNAAQAEPMQELENMVEAELEYHRQSTQVLSDLVSKIKNLPSIPPAIPIAESAPGRKLPGMHGDFETVYRGSPEPRSTDSRSMNQKQNPFPMGDSSRDSALSMNQNQNPFPMGESPRSTPIPPLDPVKKYVEITFDFDAEGPGELTVKKGEIVTVSAEINSGWWEGSIQGDPSRVGMFPSNYCQEMKSDDVRLSRKRSIPRSNSVPVQQTIAPVSRSFGSTRPSSQMPKSSYITPQSSAESFTALESSTFSSACHSCDCDAFVAHAFKPGHCNSCFHKH